MTPLRLGLGDPVALSAEHGDGLAELYASLLSRLPEATALTDEEEEQRERLVLADDEDGSELDPTKPLRIAIVGRPNAGKSTLINRLLGEDRLLVGPEAGITRDSIGVDFVWRKGDVERGMKIFDTAGIRRRAECPGKAGKTRRRRRSARREVSPKWWSSCWMPPFPSRSRI